MNDPLDCDELTWEEALSRILGLSTFTKYTDVTSQPWLEPKIETVANSDLTPTGRQSLDDFSDNGWQFVCWGRMKRHQYSSTSFASYSYSNWYITIKPIITYRGDPKEKYNKFIAPDLENHPNLNTSSTDNAPQSFQNADSLSSSVRDKTTSLYTELEKTDNFKGSAAEALAIDLKKISRTFKEIYSDMRGAGDSDTLVSHLTKVRDASKEFVKKIHKTLGDFSKLPDNNPENIIENILNQIKSHIESKSLNDLECDTGRDGRWKVTLKLGDKNDTCDIASHQEWQKIDKLAKEHWKKQIEKNLDEPVRDAAKKLRDAFASAEEAFTRPSNYIDPDIPRYKPKANPDKTTDKPITDKPITDKPITDKPITDKPITDKPIIDKPIIDPNTFPQKAGPVSPQDIDNIPNHKNWANGGSSMSSVSDIPTPDTDVPYPSTYYAYKDGTETGSTVPDLSPNHDPFNDWPTSDSPLGQGGLSHDGFGGGGSSIPDHPFSSPYLPLISGPNSGSWATSPSGYSTGEYLNGFVDKDGDDVPDADMFPTAIGDDQAELTAGTAGAAGSFDGFAGTSLDESGLLTTAYNPDYTTSTAANTPSLVSTPDTIESLNPAKMGGMTGAGGMGGHPFMPPMGGMGGMGSSAGQQGEERERTTWLSEDENVWGTDPECSPAVIGRHKTTTTDPTVGTQPSERSAPLPPTHRQVRGHG